MKQNINFLIIDILANKAECNEVVWCVAQNVNECYNVKVKEEWSKFRKLYNFEKQSLSSGLCPECLNKINERKLER